MAAGRDGLADGTQPKWPTICTVSERLRSQFQEWPTMCTDRAAAEGSIGAFHGRSWIQRRTNPLERCKRWAHSAEPRASPSTSAHPVIRVRASPHPVVLGPRVARKVRTPPVILGPRGALKVRTSPVILGSARGAEGAHTPVILGPRGARKARSAGPRIHVVEAADDNPRLSSTSADRPARGPDKAARHTHPRDPRPHPTRPDRQLLGLLR